MVGAGVYGGVTAHKAVNGTASGRDLSVATVGVVGIIAAAGLLAFATRATATFLAQLG